MKRIIGKIMENFELVYEGEEQYVPNSGIFLNVFERSMVWF